MLLEYKNNLYFSVTHFRENVRLSDSESKCFATSELLFFWYFSGWVGLISPTDCCFRVGSGCRVGSGRVEKSSGRVGSG